MRSTQRGRCEPPLPVWLRPRPAALGYAPDGSIQIRVHATSMEAHGGHVQLLINEPGMRMILDQCIDRPVDLLLNMTAQALRGFTARRGRDEMGDAHIYPDNLGRDLGLKRNVLIKQSVSHQTPLRLWSVVDVLSGAPCEGFFVIGGEFDWDLKGVSLDPRWKCAASSRTSSPLISPPPPRWHWLE